MLLGLLLECLDLFLLISQLHLQALILALGAFKILLKFGHLLFKGLLLAFGLTRDVLLLITVLLGLHLLHVQVHLQLDALKKRKQIYFWARKWKGLKNMIDTYLVLPELQLLFKHLDFAQLFYVHRKEVFSLCLGTSGLIRLSGLNLVTGTLLIAHCLFSW